MHGSILVRVWMCCVMVWLCVWCGMSCGWVVVWCGVISHCPSCLPLALKMPFIFQNLTFIQTTFLIIISKSSMVGACELCMVQRHLLPLWFACHCHPTSSCMASMILCLSFNKTKWGVTWLQYPTPCDHNSPLVTCIAFVVIYLTLVCFGKWKHFGESLDA